jgi:glycosyltransferase involved in cell wall biosynthesis
MMVGVYLENEAIGDVDLTRPEKGNPGIGGTEFLMASLPYYVNKHNPDAVEWTLFANQTENLPGSVETVAVESSVDALRRAEERGTEMLIWRPTSQERDLEFIDIMDSYSIDVIAWAHNTPSADQLNSLSDNEKLKRFVCVSREQLDRLRDCYIFNKSTVIYNGFDASAYKPSDKTKKKEKVVTYVGSLVPPKGFHVLAEIWPSIEKQVPGPELRVIGSGKLYDRGQELGEWGIAAEEYERRFRPHLSDNEGNKLDSVTFEGLVTNEKKIEIMQDSRVGVVNPTGRTENCPGSAIEFQAAGTPVVSAAKRGLLDTVNHGQTGLLGDNKKQIRDHIVTLLKNVKKADELGANGIKFVEDRFSYAKVSREWVELFDRVSKNEPPKPQPIRGNYFESWKWLRESMRLLKKYVPPFRRVPSLKKIGEQYY